MLNISRHTEVINPWQHPVPIHIIGAGATGSRLFSSLVELGFSDISLYDDDIVEHHNLSNQIFQYSDVGNLKVESLHKWAEGKLGEPMNGIKCFPFKLPKRNIHLDGMVFLLTDTMTSRRTIFNKCLKNNSDVIRVFETRMASSYGNVFSFNPIDNGDAWLKTLIKDSDAEVSACGASISVGSTASIIANSCVWQFILSLTDPNAADDIVNIFLQPLCMSTKSWEHQEIEG